MPVLTETPLMTAEEFFEWANLPENQEKLYELENGRAVEMARPGELHGLICWIVSQILSAYITERKNGYLLLNDTGLLVRRAPDSLRGPDVMLFLESLPIAAISVKYCERVPNLIVEVLSPNDRYSMVMKRVDQYIRRGVQMVWVVDPDDRVITSHKPGEINKVYDEGETIIGNGVLPEFHRPVSDFFNMPGTAMPPMDEQTL